ncbi:MAG: restriction endonuclease subunit S [Desulfobacteraceae bacterium]|nr:restriction endonuclease subunit S [Pseudomonadota bacterium]MCG2756888.1 restriction endonuclease subunit S [Desulfobacteraceae bacterium]
MSEWNETIVKNIGKVITGKTPSINNPEHWGDKTLFITPTDFRTESKYIFKTDRYLSEEGVDKFKKNVIPPESVIVTCIGSDMGKVAINRFEATTNQQINSLIVSSNYDTDFIYYKLKSIYKMLRLFADGGSIMPIINKSTIDLLRRQNETLEAIAQALFKRWFVEFEFPDENGLPYKSSGGKMVSSELGEIPAGWRVIELSELVETITKGTTPTTLGKKFVDKGINFIKAESITSNHTFDKNKFAHIDEQTDQLLNRSKIQQGDFLYTIAGTIGRFAVVTERVLPANTNQAIAIIRLKKNLNISPYQLLCYLKSHFYQTYLRSRIVQAVQANLSLGELKNTPIILAENSVQSKFSKIAKSLFNKIEKNEKLIGLLVQTRDILLPKLMSGQIRVK